METVQTKPARFRTRRVALALSLVVFFAGFCVFSLRDSPSLSPRPLQVQVTELPVAQPAAASSIQPMPPAASNADAAPGSGESIPTQPTHLAASKPDSPDWAPLVARLAADGFDASRTESLFASLKSPPLPEFMAQKAIELYGRYGKATLNVVDEKRDSFAPPDYTRIAGGMTVAAGRRTMENNKQFYEAVYKRYGVPAPFVVAVMMVETGLGAEVGKQSALLALGSMAVTDSLEHVLPVITGLDTNRDAMRTLVKARSDWAYGELKALLAYADAIGRDAAGIPGSIYGAIGICQFMPSNIPNFAVSASNKRPVPDLFAHADAAVSVARYLSAHGWKKAQTPAAQIAVLRSYNNSDVYASTVYGVATALIAPSTHRGAESARKGGNAVTAARESARASIPSHSRKASPMAGLLHYSDLLQEDKAREPSGATNR